MYWQVLDTERQALLKDLAFLKDLGFYLAGGTALALQIGHRTSVDFDFYSPVAFNPEKIIENLKQHKLAVVQQSEDTLAVRVDEIESSFFKYPYKLLKPLIEEAHVNLASLEDIAAMKVIAITQRGLYRDFIDLFFLSKIFGLEEILDFAKEKYPPFSRYLALQALTYFDDANEDSKTFKAKFFKEISWETIKKFFTQQAKIFKEKEFK